MNNSVLYHSLFAWQEARCFGAELFSECLTIRPEPTLPTSQFLNRKWHKHAGDFSLFWLPIDDLIA
jgi:hypothetical protein